MSDFVNTIDLLGDEAVMDSIIDRTITEFHDNVITSVGTGAFRACTALTSVDLPNVTSISNEAFHSCSALTKVDLPNLTSINMQAFQECISLTEINMPMLTGKLQYYAFYNCSALERIVLPNVTIIDTHAFTGCTSLKYADFSKVTALYNLAFNGTTSLTALVLRNTVLAAMNGSSSLNNTYIYVPKSLIENYKVATNWSAFAARFRALEDYTVDGTITGELDESKI